VRLASSLAAALLDGLFEHPDPMLTSTPFSNILTVYHVYTVFFAARYWQNINCVHSEIVATLKMFLPSTLAISPGMGAD
jgi:hypothetical protein